MGQEFEYPGLQYDSGYGDVDGDLIIEVEPIIEDQRFDAHNEFGFLSTYGNEVVVTGIKSIDATFFAVDNDGGNTTEYTFTDVSELQKYFGITEQDLIEKYQDRLDSAL